MSKRPFLYFGMLADFRNVRLYGGGWAFIEISATTLGTVAPLVRLWEILWGFASLHWLFFEHSLISNECEADPS